MKLNELNFIIIIDGIETEFSFPEGAKFRYFTNGGDGNYSILTAPRFIEFRIPFLNALDFMNNLDYSKRVDKVILINKNTKTEVLNLGSETDPLGIPAISIMNDNSGEMEEIMTIPFIYEEINKEKVE